LQISGLWAQTLKAQFGAAASATFAAALNDVKLAPANITAITRKIIAIISTEADSLIKIIQLGSLPDSRYFWNVHFTPKSAENLFKSNRNVAKGPAFARSLVRCNTEVGQWTRRNDS
jgi:hypothetical protein